jgi:2',3'-cyclic-nucleotide 2'-phosphodiesterase (5'-nucleotidase family)
LKYEYNPAAPEFLRVRKVWVQELEGDYFPLDLKRVYKLATNDFITHGGGAIYFPPLREDEYVDTGVKQEDIAAEYLRSHEVYFGKIEGKIVAVDY